MKFVGIDIMPTAIFLAVCVIRILKQNGLITAEEFQKMRTIIAKETGSYSYSLL